MEDKDAKDLSAVEKKKTFPEAHKSPFATKNVDSDKDVAPSAAPDLPVGPEVDENKKDAKTYVSSAEAREMRESTDSEPNTPKVNHDSRKDAPQSDSSELSNQVVATVPNKTPAELAAETPRETENRYGVAQKVSDEDLDNPRVQVYRDTLVNQVPSGTHLHPDVAKDLLNRGISEQHTDNAQVKRMVTDSYDFAPDAEHNDKF